jgi:small subunit ribosomal protein S5
MSKSKVKSMGAVDAEGLNLVDRVVKINRCATVVKGGKRFSFAAMVVVGDGQGVVGSGFGKANEVPPSVEKAVKDAKKHLFRVPLRGHTLPHPARGRFGASIVQILPAAPGTGVIAGAAVRAVMESAGVRDVLTKAYGSTNPVNLVKATLDALGQMRTISDVERLRGVKLA